MIAGRSTRLWLLGGQELMELLPVLISQSRQSRHERRRGDRPCDRGGLPPSTQNMKVLRQGLMVPSEMRPVQAVSALLRPLSHGLQETMHLWQR